MAARLILNADDFGLTLGINRAIGELHAAGVLTSATLMASGTAFEDAVALAKSLPSLGVGCHVVLVDGTPVSSPADVPTLLGPDRRTFRTSLPHFVRDLLLGRVNEEEIAHEALAQVQKLQLAGIDVTHIDTHKHTHCFPQVARALIGIADKTLIGGIRKPYEPAFADSGLRVPFKRRAQIAFLQRFQPVFERLSADTLTTDGTLGIAATGSLEGSTMQDLLSDLPEGSLFELCCHPGYHDDDLARIATRLRTSREIEREALLATIPKILALPQPPQLIHYGNLKKRS